MKGGQKKGSRRNNVPPPALIAWLPELIKTGTRVLGYICISGLTSDLMFTLRQLWLFNLMSEQLKQTGQIML